MQRRTASNALNATKGKGKMFLRKETKWGDTYYVLNRWPEAPKPPEVDEYFQFSDLVLDLDDMFSKHVRPSSEEDEELALKKWSQDGKRKDLQRKLYRIEKTLDWSRAKTFELYSNPSNGWRLGSHDIFSAALRAPSSAPLIASSESRQGSSRISTAETQTNKLRLISSNNGIAKHVVEDDSMLLRWLQSRTKVSWSEQHSTVSPSHSIQLSAALENQDSITSIRRLVSQCLSLEQNSFSFHQPQNPEQGSSVKNLSSDLRNACENILKQDSLQNKHDVLVFLGNLVQRLSARGDHVGGPLCGLGLKLSAEILNPTVAHRYYLMGHEVGYWTDNHQGSIDMLQGLETYLHNLNSGPQPSGLDLNSRQELLQLLLHGTNEENHLVSDDALVRTLVAACLRDISEEEEETALDAYRTYIGLFGHLGNAHLLSQQYWISAKTVEVLTGQAMIEDKKHQLQRMLPEAFQAAMNTINPSVSVVDERLKEI
ncbi:hypothetical protein F53441_14216 [Fusarium austroafricanum]|uniref:Uncharacterized protein n=1 Tax=Fusarium austroafricanum TaxID=2364996 RepID=A0A8H4JGB3_9HYPO|nr:hypothetical protein F53441_14216 [Fusarium austroafricanum]